MSTGEDMWEQSKNWFNNLNSESKNQIVLVLYKLCMTTRDSSHQKIIDILNNQWAEKHNAVLEENKILAMENQALVKVQESSTSIVLDKIKDLEYSLNNSVNNLTSKIVPTLQGKIGEDVISNILSKIPNSILQNVTQIKGCGDFVVIIDNIRIMIESKNWTDASIKGNPSELANFRQVAIDAKENNLIDFAIMAMQRVTNLKGRALQMETEPTKNGQLVLIYTTNLYHNPDRLLYAIDAGIVLFKQEINVDKDRFLYQINNFLKGIESLENSIKERSKLIKNMSGLIRTDSDNLSNMRTLLSAIINESNIISPRDKLINVYIDLLKENKDAKITKILLEAKCIEVGIPVRSIRDVGMRELQKVALEKLGVSGGGEPEEDLV